MINGVVGMSIGCVVAVASFFTAMYLLAFLEKRNNCENTNTAHFFIFCAISFILSAISCFGIYGLYNLKTII